MATLTEQERQELAVFAGLPERIGQKGSDAASALLKALRRLEPMGRAADAAVRASNAGDEAGQQKHVRNLRALAAGTAEDIASFEAAVGEVQGLLASEVAPGVSVAGAVARVLEISARFAAPVEAPTT